MNGKVPKDIAASIRQRLLNKSKADDRPFQETVQYYAMERFLYRLSQSSHADKFILKGALLLRVWHSPQFRPTMDIDMLGMASNEEQVLVPQILDIDWGSHQINTSISLPIHPNTIGSQSPWGSFWCRKEPYRVTGAPEARKLCPPP